MTIRINDRVRRRGHSSTAPVGIVHDIYPSIVDDVIIAVVEWPRPSDPALTDFWKVRLDDLAAVTDDPE